jgi:hypothetical protein
MENNQGFTQSHWMLPSGECMHRISPAAAMVIDGGNTQNTNETLLLASDYSTLYLDKVAIFITQKGPPTHVIDATSCVEM